MSTMQAWTPIKPDGTIDEMELRRPTLTLEPTCWEVAIPTFGARQSAMVCALFVAARDHHRHRFWALTSQLKTLPEIEWPENITLAVGPLRTQVEVGEAILALLAVRATRREAVFEPMESLRLWCLATWTTCPYCGRRGMAVRGECGPLDGMPAHVSDLVPTLDAVRVHGGDPEHVASLREQCKAAGVEFIEES